MSYNYNGDNMNSGDVIVNIKSINDIDNINENTITGYAGNDTEADGEVEVSVASVSV